MRVALPVACLLGAAVAVLPSIATGTPPPGTASFTAIDDAWQANGGSGTAATIAQGGTVTFSYPSGGTSHNADFGVGAQPTSCSQSAGTNSGAVPPLPHQPTSAGWSGSCTFDTPGTYTFHCDLHTFMTATITVVAPGTTTDTTTTGTTTTTTTGTTTTGTTTGTTTTTTTGTTTGTTTTGTTTTGTTTTGATTTTGTTTSTTPTSPPPPREPAVPIGPPLAGSAANAISVPAVQHGSTVHGAAQISHAGAGGRLEVDLFAPAGSVAAHAARMTLVGRSINARIAAGTARFSVKLDAAARRALHRHGRLVLTVRVSVRSLRGVTATAVRRVRLLN